MVVAPIERVFDSSLIGPLQRVIDTLPTARVSLDQRRTALTDYDAYTRKVETARLKHDETELVQKQMKLEAARNLLESATDRSQNSLDDMEQAQDWLVGDIAVTALACQVHMHKMSVEVLEPLLPSFPAAATVQAKLSQRCVRASTQLLRFWCVHTGTHS